MKNKPETDNEEEILFGEWTKGKHLNEESEIKI
jgi:hypothetical protein